MIRKNFSSARRNRTWRTKATTVSTSASARLASKNMVIGFSASMRLPFVVNKRIQVLPRQNRTTIRSLGKNTNVLGRESEAIPTNSPEGIRTVSSCCGVRRPRATSTKNTKAKPKRIRWGPLLDGLLTAQTPQHVSKATIRSVPAP